MLTRTPSTRPARGLASLLASGLVAVLASPGLAAAQTTAAGGDEGGNKWFGYILTGLLIAAAVTAITMSSRRSV